MYFSIFVRVNFLGKAALLIKLGRMNGPITGHDPQPSVVFPDFPGNRIAAKVFHLLRGCRLPALAALLLVFTPRFVAAEPEELVAGSITGGGGVSSGGQFGLHGTIAPPLGGVSSGGEFTLTGGLVGGFLFLDLPDPNSSFELWMANLPPGQQPPPDQRGPQDTPANDGVSNLLKYALGLLPMQPAANAAPRAVIRDGFLAVEFRRAVGRGVRWELLYSTDLKEWGDEPFEIEVLGSQDGIEHIVYVTGRTPVTPPAQFLRLRLNTQ